MATQDTASLAEHICKLPSEIQLMIQEHIIIDRIGNHTIHISGGWCGNQPNRVFNAYHYICKAQDKKNSTKGITKSLNIDENDDHNHGKAHDSCWDTYKNDPEDSLDTSIMTLSRDFHTLATRILYSSNRFFFSSICPLRNWLSSSVPPSLRTHIQHLHLDIYFGDHGYAALPQQTPSQWRQALIESDLHSQIANLRSLTLEIELRGLVSCWRKTQGREITEIFRVFCGLARLRDVHVVVTERFNESELRLNWGISDCVQRVHDQSHHVLRLAESREERREIRGEWAEEIKSMILGTGEAI